MSHMFVIIWALGMLIGLEGYAFCIVQNAEDILPDHKQEVAQPTVTTE